MVGSTLPNVRGSGGERVCALHLSGSLAACGPLDELCLQWLPNGSAAPRAVANSMTAAIVSNDGKRGLLNEGRTSSTKWNKILYYNPPLWLIQIKNHGRDDDILVSPRSLLLQRYAPWLRASSAS